MKIIISVLMFVLSLAYATTEAQSKKTATPILGFTVENVNDEWLVSKVFKNSGADQAGINMGDTVVSINGKPFGFYGYGPKRMIDNHAVLQDRATIDIKQGDSVDVVIERNSGQKQKLSIIADYL